MEPNNKTIEDLLTQRDTICRNGKLVKREEYILEKLKDITELVDEITESLKLKKEEI